MERHTWNARSPFVAAEEVSESTSRRQGRRRSRPVGTIGLDRSVGLDAYGCAEAPRAREFTVGASRRTARGCSTEEDAMTRLYEVWWTEDGAAGLRASFRLLGDALRYVAHWGRADDARLRTPDGDWVPCTAYDMPRDRGSEAPALVLSAPPEQQTTHASLDAGALESLRADAGMIVREVIRRTGLRQADIVERVVMETLKVLVERGRSAKARTTSAPTSDEARRRGGDP